MIYGKEVNILDTLDFLQKFGNVLFRGYYPCKDTKTRSGTKDPMDLETIMKKSRCSYYVGALKSNVVLVDYDTPESFECRLEIAKARKEHCAVIRSQEKGGHFYFFDNQHLVQTGNNSNKTFLTLSPVDYKLGYKIIKSTGEIKDSASYGALFKPDGTLREVVYCNILDDNTLDEIPFYDLRITAPEKYDFLGMGEGEGRNDLFHSYMQAVKGSGFTYEQYLETMRIINDFLLTDSFSEDEFISVTRQEEWESIHNESMWMTKNKFSHDKFAEYIRIKYHIVKINKLLHIYQNGYYAPDLTKIKRAMIKEIPSLTNRQRNEVLEYLDIICEDVEQTKNLNLIAFKNGIYDLKTNALQALNPEIVITNQIPWNYNPDAKSQRVDELLDTLSCKDEQVRYLLEEVAGSCLYRSCKIGGGKIAILLGDKHNGKSTLIEVIQAMIGSDNYSAVDLKDLGERFSTAMLCGKLANIGDDISGEYIKDTSIFKKLATGQPVKAERKGQDPFDWISYATQIYSANEIPRMKDETGAALRRLLIVPMRANFTKDTPGYDPFIIKELTKPENMEYFIQLAIDGLWNVLQNGSYTIPAQVEKETHEYEIENNSILAYVQDVGKDKILNQETGGVFASYQKFCSDSGFMPCSKSKFSKTINKAFGITTKASKIKGKTRRIYVMVTD